MSCVPHRERRERRHNNEWDSWRGHCGGSIKIKCTPRDEQREFAFAHCANSTRNQNTESNSCKHVSFGAIKSEASLVSIILFFCSFKKHRFCKTSCLMKKTFDLFHKLSALVRIQSSKPIISITPITLSKKLGLFFQLWYL